MTRYDAIVLAGGPADDVSRGFPGAPNKAFVPIAGATLVERTIASLRSSPRVARIAAVAPRSEFMSASLRGADEVREAGATMTDSLRCGLAGLDPDGLLLVAASDLPVLSREAIDEFVTLATAAGADLVYSCVERADHEAKYAGIPHTWAALSGGTYCGGGLVALRPRVFPSLARVLGRLGNARKNPVALATIFGPGVLARYALRRLRIEHAERRASELLGARVATARCTHPEIAVNVDRASDVALAQRLLTSSA